MADITILIAFAAGIASFLSPCVLPLVPAFLGYLAGTGGIENDRKRIFLHSVAYVIGFSTVFAGIGVLLNSALSGIGDAVQTWLSRIGGLIIIAFGLFLTGLLDIPYLQREHKAHVQSNGSYWTSFAFGASFAVGWSPCVGAVLGSVFVLAATQPASSFALLAAYSLGLGIPFLIVGAFGSHALDYLNQFKKFMKYFSVVMGVLLIILGILVFTQKLSLVASFGFVNALLL